MSEGPTRDEPAGDETVAFGPGIDLTAPRPPGPAPPPPGPARPADPAGPAVDGGEAAGSSSPWRTRSASAPVPPAGGAPPPLAPGSPGRGAGSSSALTSVAVGGVVVLVVVVVLMAVVLGFADDDPDDGASADSTTTTTASTTTAVTTATTIPGPGGSALPAGLLCRDLLADGVSYEHAVAYWLQQGRPPQMDEDRNGIPCETVYPATAVEAVWGPQGLADDGVEPGLLCRDLAAEGLTYEAAVAYWLQEGRPDRMDDDGNGRPCETVYPPAEVAAFWG